MTSVRKEGGLDKSGGNRDRSRVKPGQIPSEDCV